ncbi:MAG: MarR family transcriptional regulator [Streptosporangiales bacterium]|nr:MarR family transcriptional regulator [Streptosporangiales bacterium]
MRLSRRLRAQRAAELDALPATQVAALATLEQHGPLALNELARRERVKPPSMTRIVAQLEQRALVERTAHPTDRRQALFAPTVQGRRLIKEDRKRRDAWLAQRLKELTPAERDALRAAVPVLEKLATA